MDLQIPALLREEKSLRSLEILSFGLWAKQFPQSTGRRDDPVIKETPQLQSESGFDGFSPLRVELERDKFHEGHFQSPQMLPFSIRFSHEIYRRGVCEVSNENRMGNLRNGSVFLSKI